MKTMKKTYFAPALEELNVMAQSMIAVSPTLMEGEANPLEPTLVKEDNILDLWL